MQTVLVVIHVLITIALIGLILIQRGKGADIGAAFGSGASNTVFGSQGSASFLTRTTAILATLFFISSLTLAYFSTKKVERNSVTEISTPASSPAVPEVPSGAEETGQPSDTPDVPSTPVSGDQNTTDVPNPDTGQP
jgi:preprotein translocase subunit SecG